MKSKPKKKLKVKPKKKLPAKKPVAKKAAKKKRVKTPKGGWAWIIRSCDPKMKSDGGFKWKARGIVKELPGRWSPISECGYGLHGCLYSQATGSAAWRYNIDDDWDFGKQKVIRRGWFLVCRVPAKEVVYIGSDKVKFPWCQVMERFPSKQDQKALAYLEKMDAKETSE